MANPIRYTDLLDKEGIERAIRDLEAANREFGKTTVSVNAKIKESYDQIEAQLRQYLELLRQLNIAEKSTTATLVSAGKEIPALTAQANQYKETISSLTAVNGEVSRSVKLIKAENRDLIKEYERLNPAIKEHQQRMREIEGVVRQNKVQVQQLTAGLRLHSRQVTATAGTYDRLQQETREMLARLKAMPNAFNQVTGAINRNNREAVQLQRQILANQKVLKQFDRQIGVFNRNVGNYRSALGGLSNGFFVLSATITALYAASAVLSPIFNKALNLDRYSKSLEIVSGDTEEFRKNQEFLINTARQYGLEVLSLTDAYVRFSAATNNTNLEGEKAREIFEQTSNAISRLNLGVEDVNGLFRAFEQIISKGKLQAEELRLQLGDRIPGAFAIAAKAMGVTRAELDKMLKSGEVLAEEFLPAFAAELQRSFGDGATYVETMQAAVNRLNNSFTELVDNADVQEFFSGIINATTELLNELNRVISPAEAVRKEFSQQAKAVKEIRNEIEPLLDRYTELGSKQQLSAEEQKEFAEIIERISQRFPQAITLYDQQGRAVEFSTQKVRDNIGVQKQFYESLKGEAIQNATKELEELNEEYEKLSDANKRGVRVLGVKVGPISKAVSELIGDESIGEISADRFKGDAEALKLFNEVLGEQKLRELDVAVQIRQKRDELVRLRNDQALVTESTKALNAENQKTTEDAKKSKTALDLLKASLSELEKKIEDMAARGLPVPDAIAEKYREVKTAVDLATAAVEDFKDLNDTVVETDGLSRPATGVSGAGQGGPVAPRFDAFAQNRDALNASRHMNVTQLLDAIIAAEKAGQDQITAIYRNALAQRIAMDKASAEQRMTTIKELVDFTLQSAQQLGNLLFENGQERIQNELSMLNAQKEKELEIAGENEEAKKAIRNRYVEEERQLRMEQARQEKQQALFTIAINTAQAVMATLGQTGFFGIPLAAIVGALGAAQLAIVAARPLPQYYKGTSSAKEGPARVAEYGAEIIENRRGERRLVEKDQVVMMEGGERVYTAAQTKRILDQVTRDGGRMIEVHERVGNEIHEARKIEVEHTMTVAFGKVFRENNAMVTGAIERAVSQIPVNNITMDERGFTRSIRNRNTTVTKLESRYSLK